MYRSFAIAQFQGLNLVDDPQEAGCIDALNVSFDERGRLKTRPGYASLVTKSGSTGAVWTDRYEETSILFLSTSTNTYALDPTDGTQDATLAVGGLSAPAKMYSTTAFGGSVFYFGDTTNIRKYVPGTATFSSLSAASVPPASFCAPQYGDNRLVLGRGAVGGEESRLFFSDAGAHETFGANNYVDLLAHGDTSGINGIQAWRDQLFVFKASSFYVFYGNSVDSTGNPVFNYRPVSTGIGLGSAGSRALTAANDGVYFANAQGVWRTTGGPPEKLSEAIEPIFTGNVNPAFQAGDMRRILGPLLVSDRYLYVGYRSEAAAGNYADLLLVYSFRDRQWTVWDLGSVDGLALGRPMTSSPDLDDETLFISSGATVYRMRTTDTTDAGSAISWRWRTGFMDLGSPGSEKVVREWHIDGSGSVTVKTAFDNGSLGTGASVTLGTAPAVDTGRDRRSVKGRNVSLELSGSGQASVSRVVPMIASERDPGLGS